MSKRLEELGKELIDKERVLMKTEREGTRAIIDAYLELQANYPQHFAPSTVKYLTKNNKSKKGKR